MMSIVLSAVLLAAAPAADPAAPAEAPAAKAAGKAKAAKPEMVCRKEEVLGSRMKQRICMTQEDWDARQRQDRMDLDRGQTQKPLTF